MLNESYHIYTNRTFFNKTDLNGNQDVNVFKDFKVNLDGWFLCVAFLIIMCTGVLGNVLVIYVFGYVRRKKTKTTELLIIYLAVVDLLTSLFNPPLFIYWTLNKFAWNFGWLGCKLLPAIGPIMTTTSGWILIVFAVERYVAIVLPFYGKFNSKNVTIFCFISAVISTLMYAHYINALTYESNICYVRDILEPDYSYPNCIFIVVRLISFLVIFSVTNVLIFRSLQKNKSTLTIKGVRRDRNQQSRRIMKILFVMGIVFFVLVFPRELFYLVYNLSWMVDKTNGVAFDQNMLHVNSWLKVMHTANSCANVFIYAHMQTLYRRQITKFLYFIRCRKYIDDFHTVGSVTQSTFQASHNINNNTHRPCNSCPRGDSFRGIPTKGFFNRAQKWKILTDDAKYDVMYL